MKPSYRERLPGLHLNPTTKPSSDPTYGGQRTDEQYAAIAGIINDEFEGAVNKVEDAALFISRCR
jgi:hypothetical protein